MCTPCILIEGKKLRTCPICSQLVVGKIHLSKDVLFSDSRRVCCGCNQHVPDLFFTAEYLRKRRLLHVEITKLRAAMAARNVKHN